VPFYKMPQQVANLPLQSSTQYFNSVLLTQNHMIFALSRCMR
jgi:hypothetical protein